MDDLNLVPIQNSLAFDVKRIEIKKKIEDNCGIYKKKLLKNNLHNYLEFLKNLNFINQKKNSYNN